MKNREKENEELKRALAAVVNTDAGKRVLFWLLERCNVYGEAFSESHSVSSYHLGRMSIGRLLIAKMDEINPQIYPKLLLDYANMRAIERAAKSKNVGNDDDLDG